MVYCSWNSPHNTCAACRQFGVIFTENSFKIYKNFTTFPKHLLCWVGWNGRMKRTENALLVMVLSLCFSFSWSDFCQIHVVCNMLPHFYVGHGQVKVKFKESWTGIICYKVLHCPWNEQFDVNVKKIPTSQTFLLRHRNKCVILHAILT